MAKKNKLYVAEISCEDGTIVEFQVVATGRVEARDATVKHLSGRQKWKSIRVRDTVGAPPEGLPRVLS